MSASSASFPTGAIAHVNFRVRCEKLGHGEDVFLVQESDHKMQKVRSRTDAVGLLIRDSNSNRDYVDLCNDARTDLSLTLSHFVSCFLTLFDKLCNSWFLFIQQQHPILGIIHCNQSL